ncbi:Ger(x)C family spore germination protein [Alicyclobacillus sp. SO9]|uniref:Ger(x)C family spore germination protein n=1 Tax=Alicyclobacillus sp. SO9 TaxID=2665646 RepID=UPI0018E81642|nr:Ger(x)C family spore germination protein [Alicyclobacillus sp. SO9]QQE80838.1 Ger(x)C family spore germination protein [Alicyclobacillus sp. SO9]
MMPKHSKQKPRKAASVALLGLLLLAFVTGCTPDMTEVDDINIVLAVGVDQIDDKTVQVTAQIVRPQGQSGQQDKSSESQCLVESVQGRTIEDAMQQFELELPRKTFLPHNTMFVFGKSYAEKGLDRAFDYLERDRNYRRNQLLLLTQGSARTLLTADTAPESVNAMGIRQLVKQYGERSKQLDSIQLRVMREFLSASKSPIMTDLKKTEAGAVKISGIGVFHSGRVTTWLNNEETMGLIWFRGPTHNIVMNFPCKNSHAADTGNTFRILSTHVKVVPAVSGTHVHYTVHLDGQAEVLRVCQNTAMKTETINQLEKSLAQDVKLEMQSTMAKLKASKVDGVKFGTVLFQHNPTAWRRFSKDWDTTFQAATVTYDVKFHILRNGLSSSSPNKDYTPQQLPPKAGRKGETT